MKAKIIFYISFLAIFLFTSNVYTQIKLKNLHTDNQLILSNDLKYEDKNAAYAGVASFIVPGFALGQLYNERYDKFGIHVCISAGIVGITSLLLSKYPVYIEPGGPTGKGDVGMTIFLSAALLYIGNWIYSIVDSVVTANNINKRNEYLNKARTQLNKFELGLATNEQKKLQVKLKLNL